MSKIMNDECRKAFENELPNVDKSRRKGSPDQYADHDLQFMYLGFQSAWNLRLDFSVDDLKAVFNNAQNKCHIHCTDCGIEAIHKVMKG